VLGQNWNNYQNQHVPHPSASPYAGNRVSWECNIVKQNEEGKENTILLEIYNNRK
jgi:hypothetical protein